MLEFKKLCAELEELDPIKRGLLLTDTSIRAVRGLKKLDLAGIEPVETLVAFIVGSVVSDGVIDEQNYLGILPALIKAFGDDVDIDGIKTAFKVSKDAKKEIEKFTKDMMAIISAADEELSGDLITLCLLVTSVDGKITLKERNYIRKLCRA